MTPLFVTSKGGALDVTISLRAFLGKMASVRQILPRAPSKDTLSDLNAVGSSPYQAGFACLSRLCLATYAIASRLWRLAPPAKLRDPRFRARLYIQVKARRNPRGGPTLLSFTIWPGVKEEERLPVPDHNVLDIRSGSGSKISVKD